MGPDAPIGQGRKGLRLAQAACGVGLAFAAASVYWALGGTWLLATIDRSLEEQARAGSTSLTLLAWAAAFLKMIAALLPLAALHRPARPGWNRGAWVLAWLGAGILTFYGLVSTAASLLAWLGVFPVSPGDDHGALAWHVFLWGPWFLIWGLLIVAALLRGRHHRSQAPAHG